MPFPLLAHQTPVLPLAFGRRRSWSVAALTFGSIAPDLEFVFGPRGHGFMHTVAGQFVACLPVTVALTILTARIAVPALAPRLSAHRIGALLAEMRDPLASRAALWRTVRSALVGSFSHIALDGFTHANGWAVRFVPALAHRVPFLGLHVAIARVLQYVWTVVGSAAALALVAMWYARQASRVNRLEPRTIAPSGTHAMLFATTLGIGLALLDARAVVSNPPIYLDRLPLYAAGYVLFRAACAGFVGLLCGSAIARALDARTLGRDPVVRQRTSRMEDPQP